MPKGAVCESAVLQRRRTVRQELQCPGVVSHRPLVVTLLHETLGAVEPCRRQVRFDFNRAGVIGNGFCNPTLCTLNVATMKPRQSVLRRRKRPVKCTVVRDGSGFSSPGDFLLSGPLSLFLADVVDLPAVLGMSSQPDFRQQVGQVRRLG